jgi:hypothetical protein
VDGIQDLDPSSLTLFSIQHCSSCLSQKTSRRWHGTKNMPINSNNFSLLPAPLYNTKNSRYAFYGVCSLDFGLSRTKYQGSASCGMSFVFLFDFRKSPLDQQRMTKAAGFRDMGLVLAVKPKSQENVLVRWRRFVNTLDDSKKRSSL